MDPVKDTDGSFDKTAKILDLFSTHTSGFIVNSLLGPGQVDTPVPFHTIFVVSSETGNQSRPI